MKTGVSLKSQLLGAESDMQISYNVNKYSAVAKRS